MNSKRGILRKLKKPGDIMLPRIINAIHIPQHHDHIGLEYSKGLLQTFGGFHNTNVQFLGNGGLGVVGQFVDGGIDYVVKTVLLPFNVNNAQMACDLRYMMRNLVQEVKMHLLAYERCPDITCRPIRLEVFGPIGFFVMEKLPGQTLNDIMYDENFDVNGNMDLIAEGVANCVTQLHQAGIVHLDFKVDNLMFTGNTVKLIDFGNAKQIETMRSECQQAAASGRQVVYYRQNHHFMGLQLYCTNPVRTPQYERLVMQAEKNSAILCLIDVHQRRIVTFNPDFEENPSPLERTAQLIRIFGAARCEELCFGLRHNTKFLAGNEPNPFGFGAFCPAPLVMEHMVGNAMETWLDELLAALEPAARAAVIALARLL